MNIIAESDINSNKYRETKHYSENGSIYFQTNIQLIKTSYNEFYLSYVLDKDTLNNKTIRFYLFRPVNKILQSREKEEESEIFEYENKRYQTYCDFVQLAKHPGIIQPRKIFKDVGEFYNISDFETLENLILNYKKLFGKPPSECLIRHFTSQILQVLIYLHERNFILRNLTIENIIVTFSFSSLEEIKKKYSLSNFKRDQSLLELHRVCFKQKINLTDNYFKAIKINDEMSPNEVDSQGSINDHTQHNFPHLFYYDEKFSTSTELFEEILLMSQLKLIDFSSIRQLSIEGTADTILNKEKIISPEMIIKKNSNESYDDAVDSWHLGNIVYFMKTGYYPFSYSQDLDFFNSTIPESSNSEFVLPLYEDISYEFIDFLLRALQFDSQFRLKSNVLRLHSFLEFPLNKLHVVSRDRIPTSLLTFDKTGVKLNVLNVYNISDFRIRRPHEFDQLDFEIDSDRFISNNSKVEKLTECSRLVLLKIFDYCITPEVTKEESEI